MKILSLSVIIPVYNEERCLAQSLMSTLRFLKVNVKDFEVIVVDDGSRDKTQEILRRFEGRVKVLRNEPNAGKGFSVNRGFLEASKSWALFMDADLSTPLEEIKHAWQFHQSFDLIFGSRKSSGARIIEHQRGLRQWMGRLFPFLVQLLILPDFLDTQCGFKMMSKKAIQKVCPRQRINRFGFDVELLLIAKRQGLRLKEVGVTWKNSDRSTLNPLRDPFKMFWELLKIKWNDWKGLYG
ncbi:MAG: dolichyl-phosphate beta-glucosyltransferase [Nanoarchaeota archaeon]